MISLYEKFNSLGVMLKEISLRFYDKPAIIFFSKIISYKELENFSNQIANFLIKRGIKKGDNVCLYSFNSPSFIFIYFGIVKTGATVVPINILLSPEEVKFIIIDCRAKGLFYSDKLENNLLQIKDKIQNLNFFVSIGDSSIKEAIPLNKIEENEPVKFEIPLLNQKEDVAAILYTSGTTGYPKGAMLTHRNLLFDVNSILQVLNIDEKDIFLTVLPLFHSFGSTAGMICPIAVGATISLLPKFIPSLVANTIKETKATIFLGVPSMYKSFINLSDEYKSCFHSLRFCISGGDFLPIEVLKKFEERYNVLIYEGDGPTECSPVTCVNPTGKRKIGSVGKPLPGIEMKIIDEKGNELKDGEIGEIAVKGENVMKGYFNREKDTKDAFLGEWFLTGDIGYRDEDGYFYIVDRKKDIIIVSGMNVYPRIIENVIIRHPSVAEVSVVGVSHPVFGQVPKAYIVLKSGKTATHKEILNFCSNKLGKHEIPRIIEFVPELPKTFTGKILKYKLK